MAAQVVSNVLRQNSLHRSPSNQPSSQSTQQRVDSSTDTEDSDDSEQEEDTTPKKVNYMYLPSLIFKCNYTCTCIHYLYTCIYMMVCYSAHSHTHIHTYTHTYTHIHTYTHTHTHTSSPHQSQDAHSPRSLSILPPLGPPWAHPPSDPHPIILLNAPHNLSQQLQRQSCPNLNQDSVNRNSQRRV